MTAEPNDRFIPPGTRVRLAPSNGKIEYGVVVHCWFDEEIQMFDCYTAFFGTAQVVGKPDDAPYVLRYAAVSLDVIEPEV